MRELWKYHFFIDNQGNNATAQNMAITNKPENIAAQPFSWKKPVETCFLIITGIPAKLQKKNPEAHNNVCIGS